MIEVKVCAGTNCTFNGSLDILEYLNDDENLQDKIKIVPCNCINHECNNNNAPVVQVDDKIIIKATLDKVLNLIGEKLQ